MYNLYFLDLNKKVEIGKTGWQQYELHNAASHAAH